jgi:HEPN domain-containing protein
LNERIEYWLKLSDYDIETARVMLKGKRYLYVGFMCHQVVEKALKAVISRDCAEGEMPPKIHNLTKLANKAGLYEEMTNEQLLFIDEINPLNIEARYPEYKNQVAANLSDNICKEMITKTEDLLCWIRERL